MLYTINFKNRILDYTVVLTREYKYSERLRGVPLYSCASQRKDDSSSWTSFIARNTVDR
jgi:hypothetical protein